jgi:hypothetical protein
MPLEIVVGAQWGDEGKGRVVDLLSEKADISARYNGGDNAGHTVTVGEKIFKLHIIPSGFIHPKTIGVLGNGMVINPSTLVEEMDMLKAAGVEVSPSRLFISDAAPRHTGCWMRHRMPPSVKPRSGPPGAESVLLMWIKLPGVAYAPERSWTYLHLRKD